MSSGRSASSSGAAPGPAAGSKALLAQRMRERWWSHLRRQQGELTESDLKLTIDTSRSPGTQAPRTQDRGGPVERAPSVSLDDLERERAEMRRQLEVERAELESRLRAAREKARLESIERARRCGLEPLLDRGPQLAELVERFVTVVHGAMPLLAAHPSFGPLPGQLGTDLEALPAAMVQEVSRQYYELVAEARRSGARVTPGEAREMGEALADFLLSRLQERIDRIDVIGEGETFDAVICALQAAHASLRPRYGLPRDLDPLEGWIASVPPRSGGVVDDRTRLE